MIIFMVVAMLATVVTTGPGDYVVITDTPVKVNDTSANKR